MKLKAVIASTIVTFGALGTMTTFAATGGGSTADGVPTTASAVYVGQMDDDDKQLVVHEGGAHRRHRHHAHRLQDAAAVLGMTEATLKSQLNSGKSILQLAQQKRMSKRQLVAALTARFKTRLDQAVKDGKLSADKAARILKRYPAHLDKFINHKGGFHHGKNAKHTVSPAAN